MYARLTMDFTLPFVTDSALHPFRGQWMLSRGALKLKLIPTNDRPTRDYPLTPHLRALKKMADAMAQIAMGTSKSVRLNANDLLVLQHTLKHSS